MSRKHKYVITMPFHWIQGQSNKRSMV